ncbi:uncharacterized protein LOC126746433 [Anthonomus grandis grandis]|uniref:uncharacterized protein LOC126746433 n=1 Tax=Anthonomus grandis grandis TaxID=2921223 RepID=UPI002166B8DC|nr:uncharacterized protein LOC126746433 [Anthonomus grandis grandis]
MWRPICIVLVVIASASSELSGSGDMLVSKVLGKCQDMKCVKNEVLEYLDNVLGIQTDSRSSKNIDNAIFKRVERVLKTQEFRMRVPELLAESTEIVYNPRSGVDIVTDENESRGILKKKLLLPFLLLFKLKTKLLMPIFVALASLKAFKALILSKLAIILVLGFIIYQLCVKSGMPMPMMTMSPVPEPPMTAYGPPLSGPSTATPSSYEPGWEPNAGGPYSRVWTSSNNDAQNLAYSGYYSGASISSGSSTIRP